MNFKYFNLLIIFTLAFTNTKAQNIPVQSERDIFLREKQLLTGELSSSLNIRPSIVEKASKKFEIKDSILPLSIQTKYNSKRPYGLNDGSFIGAKGFQYRVSAGYSINSKFFEAQVNPEFISAENLSYKTTSGYGASSTGSYRKFLLGQSYLNVKAGSLYAGFSNENIWWGPGQFSALVLSNNAPGFGHLQIGTKRPIKTPIFDIEFQIMSGGLNQDSLLNAENFLQKPAPFTRNWRYVNAIAVSFHPKIIKGLYIGFTRAMQFYHSSLDSNTNGFFKKYLPAVASIFNKDINPQRSSANGNDGQDQVASAFLRMVFPNSHFETYVEYGYNDFKDNIRDLSVDAQHASAFIVGFKKIIPKTAGKYISISGEITQMAQSPDYVVRNAGNWYVHGAIAQGFTHMNQILGAGSGLGNNVQTIALEKVAGPRRLGFKLQRIQNDPKRMVAGIATQFLAPINWTDITYGPTAQWVKDKWLINGELQFVHSNNYGWERGSLFNLFTSINFTYRW